MPRLGLYDITIATFAGVGIVDRPLREPHGPVNPVVGDPGPCERMANRAQAIADKHRAVREFDIEFTSLYVGQPVDGKRAAAKLALNGGGTNNASPAEKGQADFKSQFWEGADPSTDQVHHFAAYFSAGINGQWTAATVHQAMDDNSGDKKLGDAAYNLGATLNVWEAGGPGGVALGRLREIGQTIKDRICDIH